jgi:hypothetical protein
LHNTPGVRYDPRKDAYVILGVDPRAPAEEIERAYRRAALTWHPDKSPAPDAAERFHELREAVTVLREPEQRRQYDLLRTAHLGPRAHVRRKRAPEPGPFVPLGMPPAWLASRVKVQLDAVHVTLETPPAYVGSTRLADGLALVALISAVVARDWKYLALAVVFVSIARVFRKPPQRGLMAWARIVPGRKQAEYHTLDQRLHRYERWSVPFQRLCVSVVQDRPGWRVELEGFPPPVLPVLCRTRDLQEARQRAREAARFLQVRTG